MRHGPVRDEVMAAAYALGWVSVRKMPEPVARELFALIADRIWRRRGRGVRQLERNLRRVVGGDVSERELRELSRAGLRSYLRYWMEVFRLPELGREVIQSRMRITGEQKLFATLDGGRGAVLVLPHMGNYEQAGAWLIHAGYPFTTVVERLRPESLFDRFVAFRESLGMEILPLTGGSDSVFATLAQRLRDGRAVCMVGDRDLTQSGVEVDFFGRPARMPPGSAALALRTGAALMPVTLWYEGRNWGARVHDEIPVPSEGDRSAQTRAMTQSVARAFEEGIAAHPEDWHMMQRVWVEDLRDR